MDGAENSIIPSLDLRIPPSAPPPPPPPAPNALTDDCGAGTTEELREVEEDGDIATEDRVGVVGEGVSLATL